MFTRYVAGRYYLLKNLFQHADITYALKALS